MVEYSRKIHELLNNEHLLPGSRRGSHDTMFDHNQEPAPKHQDSVYIYTGDGSEDINAAVHRKHYNASVKAPFNSGFSIEEAISQGHEDPDAAHHDVLAPHLYPLLHHHANMISEHIKANTPKTSLSRPLYSGVNFQRLQPIFHQHGFKKPIDIHVPRFLSSSESPMTAGFFMKTIRHHESDPHDINQTVQSMIKDNFVDDMGGYMGSFTPPDFNKYKKTNPTQKFVTSHEGRQVPVHGYTSSHILALHLHPKARFAAVHNPDEHEVLGDHGAVLRIHPERKLFHIEHMSTPEFDGPNHTGLNHHYVNVWHTEVLGHARKPSEKYKYFESFNWEFF